MRRPRLVAPSVALYRALLVLALPHAFRRRFGREMTQCFAAWLRDAAGQGVAAFARAWLAALADLAATGARERLHATRAALAALAARRAHVRHGARRSPSPDREDAMGTLLQDLRYAVRTLARTPGVVLAVVVSLALGVGANALVYSAVDGIVYHPFAYPDADRLVALGAASPQTEGERSFVEAISPPEYLDLTGESRTLERAMAFDLGNRNISGGDRPERVFTAFVWGDPFATIGLRPALGRGFRPEETTEPGAAVAVVSHRIWQSRFGGDSSLVGRTILMNGRPVTVIGVMPPELLLLGTDLWLPMGVSPQEFPRERRQWTVLARLRDGASLDAANAELATAAARVAAAYGAAQDAYAGWRVQAAPLTEALLGDFRPAAVVLLGTVALVLLIACANIASLLLARATARQRELAVRRALGAGRARLARQLLTESVLLALAGGALGLAVAYGLADPLTSLFPARITDAGVHAAVSGRVVGYTLAVAVLAGLLFGVAPALQGARAEGGAALTAAGVRQTTHAAARRLRRALVVAEMALALVLLAGAGLLARSFARLTAVDPGFDPSHVLTMRLSLPAEKYEFEAIAPFFEQLAERVTALPGVRSAAAATQFPPGNGFDTQVATERDLGTAGAAPRRADVTNATTGFVRTMGYVLKRGRAFDAHDGADAPAVVLLNETAARRFFPDGRAVGQRLRIGDDSASARWAEVIGVVGDVRNRGLDAPTAPELFVPVAQQRAQWNSQLFLLVRTTGDPLRALPAVRAAIAELDPDQPVYAIQTLQSAFATSMAQRRIAMLLVTIFAGIALVLAAVGIYGVMSYLVSERTHEIGIRMALGAPRGRVLRLVLRETLALVAVAVVLGLGGALALGRALRSLVFGIGTSDPATLAAVALLLGAVAVAASLLPAGRATRVPPVEALRE
ncbi:MAG TPA: ABC transporter permease [Gemmatimonadaceae bacterium]|nr:ABC transporter permease [Gemmatimonadaceae bacterium]